LEYGDIPEIVKGSRAVKGEVKGKAANKAIE